MTIGRSGWLRYEADGLPGRAYLRYGLNAEARWTLRELFVDGLGTDLTAAIVGQIPLATLEAMVNSPAFEPDMRRRHSKASAAGGPEDGSNLAVLASRIDDQYVNTEPADNWVAAAYWAEVAVEADGAGKPMQDPPERVPRRRVHPLRRHDPSAFRLTRRPAADGLTDEFLDAVAQAYSAAVERDEPPNKTLAADSGAPVRTVERWVYTARARKRMPPGRMGARG